MDLTRLVGTSDKWALNTCKRLWGRGLAARRNIVDLWCSSTEFDDHSLRASTESLTTSVRLSDGALEDKVHDDMHKTLRH